ncbi:hypothetical protein [Salana multivorans]|nr:hypothetical protein [Salana multivorans]
MHRNGWRFAPETMDRVLAEGRILFGVDENVTATYKRFLAESAMSAVKPVIAQDRASATRRLDDLLGERRFASPKDEYVLGDWMDMAAGHDPNAVVLDFFGGSSSTLHAVANLNLADAGSRRCILVTNNEVSPQRAGELTGQGLSAGDPEWEEWGVFTRVTEPRLDALTSGRRPDGTMHSGGVVPLNAVSYDLVTNITGTLDQWQALGAGQREEPLGLRPAA